MGVNWLRGHHADTLSSIPRTDMVEERTDSKPPSDLH